MFRETKTSLDELKEAAIVDYWIMDGDKSRSEPWICVTRQTDEETGDNRTRKHLAKHMVKYVKKPTTYNEAFTCFRTMTLIMCIQTHCQKTTDEKPQRCLAKSPNQPTRRVQAGSGPVQVIGLKLERKD